MFTIYELNDIKAALAAEIERRTEGNHYGSQEEIDRDLELYEKVSDLIKEGK
jgi:hypothetical protein